MLYLRIFFLWTLLCGAFKTLWLANFAGQCVLKSLSMFLWSLASKGPCSARAQGQAGDKWRGRAGGGGCASQKVHRDPKQRPFRTARELWLSKYPALPMMIDLSKHNGRKDCGCHCLPIDPDYCLYLTELVSIACDQGLHVTLNRNPDFSVGRNLWYRQWGLSKKTGWRQGRSSPNTECPLGQKRAGRKRRENAR